MWIKGPHQVSEKKQHAVNKIHECTKSPSTTDCLHEVISVYKYTQGSQSRLSVLLFSYYPKVMV